MQKRTRRTRKAEPMKMRTAEQLMALYGQDCYLVVTGSKGDMPTLEGKSEKEAVQDYERRKSAKAYATIVCIPGPRGRTCVRGWIDSSRYRWDDDPESLRVEALRPANTRTTGTARRSQKAEAKKPMRQFRVIVENIRIQSIIVLADSQDEAEKRAYDTALLHPNHWRHEDTAVRDCTSVRLDDGSWEFANALREKERNEE